MLLSESAKSAFLESAFFHCRLVMIVYTSEVREWFTINLLYTHAFKTKLTASLLVVGINTDLVFA